jgi:hypothetical protein
MHKDILFYSHFCNFSKEVLSMMHKMNVKNDFLLVCVEKHAKSIPKNITCVPTIMTRTQQFLVEDDIQGYIQIVASHKKSGGSGGAADTAPQDVFSNTNAGFSYLDDPIEGNNGVDSGAYGIFGMDQRIETPDEDSDLSGESTINYERFKAQRDSDIQFSQPLQRQ